MLFMMYIICTMSSEWVFCFNVWDVVRVDNTCMELNWVLSRLGDGLNVEYAEDWLREWMLSTLRTSWGNECMCHEVAIYQSVLHMYTTQTVVTACQNVPCLWSRTFLLTSSADLHVQCMYTMTLYWIVQCNRRYVTISGLPGQKWSVYDCLLSWFMCVISKTVHCGRTSSR